MTPPSKLVLLIVLNHLKALHSCVSLSRREDNPKAQRNNLCFLPQSAANLIVMLLKVIRPIARVRLTWKVKMTYTITLFSRVYIEVASVSDMPTPRNNY